MEHDQNTLGQPLGPEVRNWQGAKNPTAESIPGRYCRIERLDPDRHAAELFASNQLDTNHRNWTYLPYGPFLELSSYRTWVAEMARHVDPFFFAVIDLASEQAVGVASLMRIAPEAGAIEIGHINYSPLLQRKRAGTEAMYLLMSRVFESWGYRRYEWKCNALNAPSMAAAERLGFTYEGTFRQADVVKGRNRDTAWYSVVDSEWPMIKESLQRWLKPDNFDESGRQRQPLASQGSKRYYGLTD